MKFYELTYLISSETDEKQRQSFVDNIISLIKENQGDLKQENPLTEKPLAYPIKKQTTAFVGDLYFSLDSDKAKEIENKLKQDNNILRFMFVVKKLEKIKEMRTRIKKPIEFKPDVIKIKKHEEKKHEEKIKTEIKPKGKVELKEIEKELDEIL
ncbi:MAG: 30S ribosomal protein S6 [Patescibacteria group bacterium]|nr:30S ribosomal protein S6 [Patescibacteria group bacterium]